MNGDLAMTIIIVTITLTIGAVTLLKPISRRLGDYLEALIDEKRRAPEQPRPALLPDGVERLEERLSRIEERLDFAEELSSRPRQLGARQPGMRPALPADAWGAEE